MAIAQVVEHQQLKSEALGSILGGCWFFTVSLKNFLSLFIIHMYTYLHMYVHDSPSLTPLPSPLTPLPVQRPPPYIPYEFTFEGMLERITAYLSNQKFCEPYQWPPVEVLKTRISEPDQSCKDACYSEGEESDILATTCAVKSSSGHL